MKLIIAGTRTFQIGPEVMRHFLEFYELRPAEIVSGSSGGVDKCGEAMAVFGFENPIGLRKFPADWEKHGKGAGPIRNKEMAEYADALLLIWDGKSRGSKNMKEEMEKLGKTVYEVIFK